MPEIIDPFERRSAGPRGPTAIQNRRLEMGATGESIESANVNQAQGRTALAVDAAVVPSDINKRRADSTKSQLEALEANVRSRIPGGLATQDERQTAFNYLRMMDAKMRSDMAVAKNKKASEAPLLPEVVSRLPLGNIASNYLVSPERRQVVANQRDMLDAALWLATGAAYNAEQKEANYLAFFPQPGDDPATIRMKNDKLDTLIKNARVRASMGLATPGGREALASATGGEDMVDVMPRAKATPKALPAGLTPAGARAQAKAAIAAGKPRAAVLQRLRDLGVDTTGL